MKKPAQLKVSSLQEVGTSLKIVFKTTTSCLLPPNNFQPGFSSLATVTLLGLLLAIFLGLVGMGVVKLPGKIGIPVSPIPVENDQACDDPYNADCEEFLDHDPEDLTPAQIQREE